MRLRPFSVLLVSGIWLLAQPACAQDPAPKAQPAQKGDDAARTEAVDPITAKQIPYRPTTTRDPFYALSNDEAKNRGELIDDIGVKGRIISNGKPMAVISDSSGNVRWLPLNYRFRDGVLVAIDEKSVTFHQWEINSTNTSVYRTVVKTFKREEGKR